MKKLIILLFFSISMNLFSQDYHPLLDTTTVWTIEYNDCIALPPEIWQVQFQFQKDTIIDLIEYKYYGSYAILREDTVNKKVYLRNEYVIGNECLLYDFNAKQGDTINVCNFQIIIDSVSTINISNGDERKIFYYQGTITGEYYIEGIGSNEGFVEISEPIGSPSIDLMCVKRQETELYGQRCVEVTSIPNLSKDNININIYPNPTNSILKFDTEDQLKSFRIFDSSGKYILQNTIIDNTIDLINFKSGFYIIEFYNLKNELISRHKFILN